MNEEIESIMNALQNKQIQVVNAYLKEKWQTDINTFIETIATMRKYNAALADSHLNSGEFVRQFSAR